MLESTERYTKTCRFYKMDPSLQILVLLTCSKITLITLQIRNTQDSDSIENQNCLYNMVVSNTGVHPICRGHFTGDISHIYDPLGLQAHHCDNGLNPKQPGCLTRVLHYKTRLTPILLKVELRASGYLYLLKHIHLDLERTWSDVFCSKGSVMVGLCAGDSGDLYGCVSHDSPCGSNMKKLLPEHKIKKSIHIDVKKRAPKSTSRLRLILQFCPPNQQPLK